MSINKTADVDIVTSNLLETSQRLARLAADAALLDAVSAAGEAMAASLGRGGTLMACGNGGSMTDAMHFAEELTGRFRLDRRPLRAIAISDPSHLTCVANDFGYEHVYSRFVEAFATENDVLLALSTSGKSPNVLRAAQAMREAGGTVVGFTGAADTPLSELSDHRIVLGTSAYADRIQETEIVVLHSLVQIIENRLGL